jgi:hypothetical protein
MIPVSRRRFMTGAAACLSFWGGRGMTDERLVDSLTSVVLDTRAAARLGGHYLAVGSATEPADPVSLSRRILPTPALRRSFLHSSLLGRKRILRRRIADDFEAGRTAEVDGWLLAETEARLAGLVAVAEEGAAGGGKKGSEGFFCEKGL